MSLAIVPEANSAQCDTIRPVIAGAATYDQVAGVLRVPVAIVNGGSRTVQGPARLYAWPDSLAVVDPPGLATNKHTTDYLAFANPDSTMGADAPTFAGAMVWRLDSLLSPTGQSQRLAPGGKSQAIWLALRVASGVRSLRFTIWASARRSSPVPAVAPDAKPNRAFFESLGYIKDPYTTYVRDMVLVAFLPGTPQADRQSAIDAIDGEVVGGSRDFGSDGFYYVQISGGTLAVLDRAAAILRALPQVSGALFMDTDQSPRGSYLKPVDGPGWREWILEPNMTSKTRQNWPFEQMEAPMAWGCATGSRSTTVAVIDEGMFDASNFHDNVGFESLLAPDSVNKRLGDHGTTVAGMLAASRGANDHWPAALTCLRFLRVHLERPELGAVVGIVTDPEHHPLDAAEVRILAGSDSALRVLRRAVTAADGRFSIDRLPPVARWAKITRIGYLSQRHELSASEGLTDTLAIVLRPRIYRLGPAR